jgi:CubicO group peptidase (beta-lactamase class C family)
MTVPGELWAYCSVGFMLAGRVVEVVTSQPFETAMRQRIFKPLGLTHSFFFAQEAMAYPTAVGHVLTTPGDDEHEVCRRYGLSRSVAPAGGIISDARDLLTFAAFFMGVGTWNGRRILSPARLASMRSPQVRAATFLAAGYAEWGGLGWAIRFIAGEQVVEHGGSLTGFQVKLTFVPARRFAIAILTNSSRGGVLGDRVAEWALDHFLDLRLPSPVPIVLPNAALARFAGCYRTMESQVTLTVEDGGLRCVIQEIDRPRDREQAYPPILLRPLSEREFIVLTREEQEGAHVDFIEGDDGAIRFLRMDGRLYDPVMEHAHC